MDQRVFGAARECVDAIFDGLPAFDTAYDDFHLGADEVGEPGLRGIVGRGLCKIRAEDFFFKVILPVGGDGHHDFGDFVHLEEGLQTVAVDGLAAQKHELLGDVSAHALAESTGGEDCRETAFEGVRSDFRVGNIACHAIKCRKIGFFSLHLLTNRLFLSKYENMNMCSYIKTAKNSK